MPTYVPTEWENETPAASPILYRIKLADGTIISDDVIIELKTAVTPGTPLDSTKLNHIEQGIKDAQDTANLPVDTAKLLDGLLSADAAGRAKMADGYVTLAKLAADLKFQRIAEFVADGVSPIDWTSIPGTFRHLLMIYNGIASVVGAGWIGVGMLVNGDASAAYSTAMQLVDPTLTRWNWGITNPHADGLLAGILPTNYADRLENGSGIVLFPNYAGTALYKSCINLSLHQGSYSSGIILSHSQRSNVAPITRLTSLMMDGPTAVYPKAGSVFSLYGLP